MKKMYRILIALSLLLALCAGGIPALADSAQEPVTITFMTTETNGEAKLVYFEALIEKFEAANPHIKVDLIQAGAWQDVEAKLNAAILSDTYPDVLLVPLSALGARAELGDYADLTPYIDAWEDKDDILPASIEVGKYKGESLAIGAYPVPEIYAFRRDYFAEAGLDPSQPPTNWDELYSYAQKLAVTDDKGEVTRGGMDIPLSDPAVNVMEQFLRQNGNTIVNPETGELLLSQDSAVETMEYLQKFIVENLTVPYANAGTSPVLEGKSAMGVVYVDMVTQLFTEDPSMQEKLGFFPYLENAEKASFCGYRMFMIGARAKHPEEAWEFIKFYYNADEMWERQEKFGNIPIRNSLADEYVALNPELNGIILESVTYGSGRPVVSFVSILTKYEELAYEEIMNGVKAPKEALDDAVAAIQQEIGQ